MGVIDATLHQVLSDVHGQPNGFIMTLSINTYVDVVYLAAIRQVSH